MVSGMLGAVEKAVDSVKGRLRRRYGINRLQIMAYGGFCNDQTAFVRGRVLVGKKVELGHQDHGPFRNFQNMSRRFLSAEISGARLILFWEGNRREVHTDEEGFFFEELPLQEPAPPTVTIRSNEPLMDHAVEVRPELYHPVRPDSLIVVSDIDDTVLMTMATRAFRMVMLTLFQNAHTRMAFADVDTWYQGLRRGPDGGQDNLFFYVSSSPWNLYDFLEEFLHVNGIPLGPMFLRNHGLKEGRARLRDHRGHKVRAIEKLLTTFPEAPFLLIGDSGQKDPEIYRELVGRFPGRFVGVLIRNVTPILPGRIAEVQRLGREIESCGCRFRLFDNTKAGLEASRNWGLVAASVQSDAVREDRVTAGSPERDSSN